MRRCRHAISMFLLGSFWAMTACMLGDLSSGHLATYVQSPEGAAEWKRSEEQLARAAAAKAYRRVQTIDALQAYEIAARAYLDHSFLLYRALDASSSEFPKGFRRFLERRALESRALELMAIADEYLKRGVSDILAVDIARAVIHKYSVGRMDRAQLRAEGILLHYRYQGDY